MEEDKTKGRLGRLERRQFSSLIVIEGFPTKQREFHNGLPVFPLFRYAAVELPEGVLTKESSKTEDSKNYKTI